MHKLQRIFAPQSRPFIIYVTLLIALLGGAQWYRGIFKQRLLAQMAASVRGAVTDKEEATKLKNERTALEFQLLALTNAPAILSDEALSNDWSAAVVVSLLYPDVCSSWRAYLSQLSPLLLAKDRNLGTYLTLQEGYGSEVELLARDFFLRNKRDQLMELRAKKFAPLFTYGDYAADAARFEKLAPTIVDAETISLRKAYEEALMVAVTNVNPRLGDYARARLESALRADELKGRVRELSQQLGEASTSTSAAAQPTEPVVVTKKSLDLLRLRSFETYVPYEKDFFGIELATFLVGLMITQPVEMRDRRWWKIGASVVLVHLGLLGLRVPVVLAASNRGTNVFAFFGFLVPAVLLAAIWASSFTSTLSRLVLQFIDPAGADETEDTRLKPAYDAARQGQYRLALKLLKPKLLLDPWHYEALLFKARLHRQLNRKWRARWTLAKVLRNRHLSAGQRENAAYMRRNLGRKSDPCWSLARREAPRQEFENLFQF